MFLRHSLPIVSLIAVTILITAPFPVTAAEAPSSDEELWATRVFYLQEIDTKEVVTLLRKQFQVRQMAEIPGRAVVIVSESPQKLDRCSDLLRELDVLVRDVDPHQPLSFAAKSEKDHPTRIFRIEGDTKAVVTVMRAIYQMRQITELPEKSSLVVTDAQPRLDAVEALLNELGLLAK